MPVFDIKITETSTQYVHEEAETAEQALASVQDRYNDEDIMLDIQDFDGTDFEIVTNEPHKSNDEPAIEITQEQAEALLQLQLKGVTLPYHIMCKGYAEDFDNYTGLEPDDLEAVADNTYTNFELWSNK